MEETIEACKLCYSDDIKVRYSGPVRSGLPGNFSSEDFKVINCSSCKVEFLHPAPNVNYETDEYRSQYNKSPLIEKYFELHDSQQIEYLNLLRFDKLRDKTICDVGCGGGAFLDHVHGLAKSTIAVEPFVGYHNSLEQRGHKVYPSIELLTKRLGIDSIDLIVSFHVIEHVLDPVEFLAQIHDLLKEEGKAVIITPNLDDILVRIPTEKYNRFFYRTVHRWYMGKSALQFIANKAGFFDIHFDYLQNYGLSNFALWLRDGIPTGNNKLDIFDSRIDAVWKSFLEEKGYADTIVLTMKKKC